MINLDESQGFFALNYREELKKDDQNFSSETVVDQTHSIFKMKLSEFHKARKQIKVNRESNEFIGSENIEVKEEQKLLVSTEKIKSLCEQMELEVNDQKQVLADLKSTSEENQYLSQKLKQKVRLLIDKTSNTCLIRIIIFLLIVIIIELCIN